MNQNPVFFNGPLLPSVFIFDRIPPLFTAFQQIDLNMRTITLQFNEPIDNFTINFTKIFLQVHYIVFGC